MRAADTTKSQNLMAVQLNSDIFYIVTKVIEPGTELRVWYAPHYARKVGKSTEPDGKTKGMLDIDEFISLLENQSFYDQNRKI